MQARRAARELAFILFSQFDKKITNYSREDLQDIILKSVRILTSSATEELKIALGSLVAMRNQIENYEADAEENLKRPIGAANIPVPIPMTSDMTGRINEMIDIAEKSMLALEIAEFTISSTFSSLIITLAEFEKRGCKLEGLVEINSRHDDWKACFEGESRKERIPALKISFS